MAGQSRLEQIRASMSGGSVAPQVTSGAAKPASAGANIEAEIAKRVAQEQKANPQSS
jgi:hypothetical protein